MLLRSKRVPLLAIVAKEMIEASLEWTAGRVEHPRPPLSNVGGGMPCLLENTGP